jgi:hypothetical protein
MSKLNEADAIFNYGDRAAVAPSTNRGRLATAACPCPNAGRSPFPFSLSHIAKLSTALHSAFIEPVGGTPHGQTIRRRHNIDDRRGNAP